MSIDGRSSDDVVAGYCIDIDGNWWNGHGPAAATPTEQPRDDGGLQEAARSLLAEYDAYRDPDGDEAPDGWMDAMEALRAALADGAPDS